MPDYTKPDDLLGSKSTAVTPEGKKIYWSSVGQKKLNFRALQDVIWKAYDKNGKYIKDVIQYKNTYISKPVDNSFITRSGPTAYFQIELSNGAQVMTPVHKTKFDLSPLETLPSVDDENSTASAKSKEANKVHEEAQKPFMQQFFDSLPLKEIAFGAVALIVLFKVIK